MNIRSLMCGCISSPVRARLRVPLLHERRRLRVRPRCEQCLPPLAAWLVVLLLFACCTLPMTGCDRSRPATPSADVTQLDSPRAVYEQLRRWHAGHSYLSMMPWIHPSSRDEVVELLVAVDELMLANTSAQVAITQSCSGIDPKAFDMSEIGNRLDLFSRDAVFVGERIAGDKAVVTVQVAERLPLKQLRFERHEERWVYVPGPLSHALTESIRLLAKGMNRFATVIAKGTCSPEDVNSEFRYRVLSRLEAFQKVLTPTTAPASRAAG